MRAISLVKKIEFEFCGNVARNALALGDVDNDGCNELVIGNDQGDIAIFKGKQRLQTLSRISFIACVAIGDIRNEGRNSLVAVTADGWCYIYEVPSRSPSESGDEEIPLNHDPAKESTDQVDGQVHSNVPTSATETQSSSESTGERKNSSKKESELKNPLVCVHMQRIPANVKNIILGDIDGDGQIEMVLGLTDRVVRSYRFLKTPDKTATDFAEEKANPEDNFLGKLVALSKWECANQIGSITLHHSFDGKPFILVAQPGGTFMRIKCQEEDPEQDKFSRSSVSNAENFPGSVDYQFLGISRMRNQNISTEIIGDLQCSAVTNFDSADSSGETSYKSRPYALATLDGSIMLVQDEVILCDDFCVHTNDRRVKDPEISVMDWSAPSSDPVPINTFATRAKIQTSSLENNQYHGAIAVDHQIFALTKLDITGNGCDDIVVCSWDGQTYILDQDKNSVRFHLEEPVRAFHSGMYNLDVNGPPVTALVYVTFKNTVILFYDIPLRDLVCKKFEPNLEKLSELFIDKDRDPQQALDYVQNMDKKTKLELVEYLLYDARC